MVANRPITLEAAPFEPDQPTLYASSAYVRNVLPRTDKSYGPIASLSIYSSNGLTLRCQGGYAGTDTDGNALLFVGDANDLYLLDSGSPTFTNVSQMAGDYSCPADAFWTFSLFKDRLIATNISDPIQTYVLGVDTAFSDLSADAPQAKYVATVKNFLVAANTFDGVSGSAPWRVWWSAIADPTSWPTPGSTTAAQFQSDYNDIVGEGGAIQGIVGNLGTADAAVFFEHTVWRMSYVGPPDIFDFQQAEGARGTPVPGSIIQLSSLVYYLGEDGFYVFDGTNSQPIGANKVDKYFFADLDPANMHRICGAADPINKIVLWAYPGSGNNQGNPNRLIAYNWVTGRWTISDIETEIIIRTLSFGYTLDTLDSTGYNLDTLPYSLDSRIWAGGNLVLSGFNLDHKLGYFSGDVLEATVDTRELQPFKGQRAFIRNTRPLVDGGSPTIQIGYRDLLTGSKTYNAGAAMNSLGWCPQRANGRYITARIIVPAASDYTNIIGVEVDCDSAGVR